MGHKWWKSNFKVKIFPSKDIAEVAGSYTLSKQTWIDLNSSEQLCCPEAIYTVMLQSDALQYAVRGAVY